MLLEKMVQKVNKLDQTNGDQIYNDLVGYFNEAIDRINLKIKDPNVEFPYFPDEAGSEGAYVGIPDRFLSIFVCYYAAANSLGVADDYDDQRMDYERRWQENLAEFEQYYWDEVADLDFEEYGISLVDQDEEVV